ncbi:7425_t:CDS:2, partial [Racocetra persica]
AQAKNTVENSIDSNNSISSTIPARTYIEIDIQQQKIDDLIEYAIDLPDPILAIFITIIKKLAQEQYTQLQYLKTWSNLLNIVKNIDDSELNLVVSLINLMKHRNGPKASKIFSKYLQQKAYNFVCRLNRSHIKYKKKNIQKINRLQKTKKILHGKIGKSKQIRKQHISKVRSIARKAPNITDKKLKLAIQDRLMLNKKQFSAKTVSMATQICEIREMSYRSAVTCMKKHQDVSNIHIIQQCNIAKLSKWFTFGIMTDESTRGDSKVFVICFMYWDLVSNKPKVTLLELQDLTQCTGTLIVHTVIKSCKQYQLDPTKYLTWTTNNTAYMSDYKNGIVALFNKEINSNSFRISCGLHSAYIMITNFENATFGKLKVKKGFSTQKHPFNLLYLIWQLHNGYSESNKDNPINMKSSYIFDLYAKLFGIQLSQFQKPLRQR